MTDLIGRSKTTQLIEQRIAKTTNPRHLLMLNRLLQHATGRVTPTRATSREALPRT